MNIQGFYTGREFDADTFFGAHPYEGGTHFAVWAPSARDVKVITSGLSDGSWAEWQMHRSYSGCWEADAAGVTRGTCYQYRVCGADGSVVDHCDPYGTAMTLRPDGRSIVWGAPTCQWTDSAWMAKRSKNFDAPLNIYEAQAGSWRCKEDGTPYTYSELAKQLPAYLKENGYTHLELMPLSEYPFDGSWGYQTTGFFAPTSRYGTPDELCTLIDACHAADIGVIFDFVPVHFAVDEYGLKHFDGTALYEYPAAAVGESEWGSCNFMHSRGEIRCFLQSAADYWLRTFHADGLRMDAVSRLIYWQGDPARGVNGSTLEFLKNMNQGLQQRHPTAMLIAEDSTNFEKVTAPVEYGGLGFDYRFAMGIPDYWEKCIEAPRDMGSLWYEMTNHRPYDRTISYVECHDQCINGDDAMIWRLLGEDMYHYMSVGTESWNVSRGLAFYRLMRLITLATADAGYLNFMGNEFGHPEWLDAEAHAHRQWYLADRPDLKYAGLAAWDKAQLWDLAAAHMEDFQQAPLFRFIHEEERLLAFERGRLLFAFNFHELEARQDLTFAVTPGKYVELLSSDETRFAGHGNLSVTRPPVEHFTKPLPDRHEQDVTLYLPPLVALVLRRED